MPSNHLILCCPLLLLPSFFPIIRVFSMWRWRGPSGLRWVWRNGRGPHLEGRQEPQASSPFRTLTSGSLQSWDRRVSPHLVSGREPRWPLELLRGSQAPRRAVCGTLGSLRTMHGGGSTPSCCAFTHRVAFQEGSGPLVLLKSGPGNRRRSACGPTHVARLEFPPETGSS